MGLLLLVVGIFAGLFLFIATTYSLAQAMLNEGMERWVHLALIVMVLFVMGALYEKQVWLARLGAVPLFGLAFYAMWIEERWFKTFPILHQCFAAILMIGLVAV
ncbi:MAG: hypothetical protein AAFT19_10670 [Pseudomonadota bacterium]